MGATESQGGIPRPGCGLLHSRILFATVPSVASHRLLDHISVAHIEVADLEHGESRMRS